jgi:hypothetical protein
MTIQELMEWVMTKLPEATLGEDNDGQIIICTNLTQTDTDKLIPLDEDEF